MDLNHITRLPPREKRPPIPSNLTNQWCRILCTHFCGKTGLSCVMREWDDSINMNQKLHCSALKVWGWSSVICGRWLYGTVWVCVFCVCLCVYGVWCISAVTLYQRSFVFLHLRESSWELLHNSAFINNEGHIPFRNIRAAPCACPPIQLRTK